MNDRAGKSYPLSMVRKARMMRQAGWSYDRIAAALGIAPSTACRWCNPDYRRAAVESNRRARARAGWARRAGRKFAPTDEFLLERARTLNGIGVSHRAIAALFAVDYGLDISEHQVRSRLRTGRWGSGKGTGHRGTETKPRSPRPGSPLKAAA